MLIDGFARGMWRATTARGATVLTAEMLGPVGGRDRNAVAAEGERLLEFAAPGSPDRELRFGPIR